ncbi:hypothetical protein GS474_15890 [Rhodococcus hoagii]|nr:hypothetical protein [Prescottella equi]NKR60212.1 hypothetical protein [Prescottella equi]
MLASCGGGDSGDAAASSSPSATTATADQVGTNYASATGNLRKAFESQGVSVSDSDLALTVPAAQTTCDTITNATDAAKAYRAAVLIAQTKFQNEETAGWFVDQSIYAFCPAMSSLAQTAQAW